MYDRGQLNGIEFFYKKNKKKKLPKSLNSDTKVLKVTITNTSKRPVELIWLDFNGKKVSFAVIKVGGVL